MHLKNPFRVKTPHGRPWRHLAGMFGYFLVGSIVSTLVFAGSGSALSGFLVVLLAGSALSALTALIGGIFATMVMRWLFKLSQTGRFLQYAGFWMAACGGFKLTLWLDIATTGSVLLAGLLATAVAFTLATYFGEVPLKGRTWLPVKRKEVETPTKR